MSDRATEGTGDGIGQRIAASASEQKRTQRQRILEGVMEIVEREGYAHTTVAQIIAHAAVSRPTFYDYFRDKDACFVGAIAAVREQLLVHVETSVESSDPARATYAAIEALVGFVNLEPAMARLLINGSLVGGPRALDARDESIVAIAQVIEQAHRKLPGNTMIPGVPSVVLVGGAYRLLGSRIRRGKPVDEDLLADLLAWIASYAQPADARRWSTLEPRPIASTPFVPEIPFRSPPLPGRRRRSRLRTIENRRQRVLFATAQVAREKGFSASTIADIARRAGVDHRRFSGMFADKQDAFLTFHDLGVRRALAVSIGGFFSRADWPERVWAAGQAFTGFLDKNPTIPPVGFVEAYAVGPRTAKQLDGFVRAFTIFLQDGFAHPDHRNRPDPSRVALDAIAYTVFEIAYLESRLHHDAELTSLLPYAAFIALAPFLGPASATAFIESKLNPETSQAAPG